MASATGVPAEPHVDHGHGHHHDHGSGHNHAETDPLLGHRHAETEPLLGRPGDVAQGSETRLYWNVVLGTAVVAQFAVIILGLNIWASVLTKPLILFSGHPLAQSLGVLILVQSILLLQPTHTAEQKRLGQVAHASLNLVAFLVLLAGVIIIEYNKFASNGAHFHSVHGYLGVITSFVLLAQYLVGFTIWATPSLYGGVSKAKSIYKYHRWSGYFVLVLLLATVSSAVETDYNKNVLGLKLWAVVLLSVLILVGVFPRIQKQKLGLKTQVVA